MLHWRQLLLILLLVELGHVQRFVDVPRDWLDLSSQLLLDPVESEPVIVGDEVDGDSEVAKSSTAANPVEVGLSHLGEVKVDDDVDGLDVDTPGEEIAADQVSAKASSEVVEDSITVSLGHLGVDVVAGVAQLSDLLGQELYSLCGVTEDNALVDLKFGEESVETVDLLSLLDKCVVLSDSLQGQLVHQVDLVGLLEMLPHERLHSEGEGRAVEEDLSFPG